MNEKAGMNEVELEKFMQTNIGRLYPDVRDVDAVTTQPSLFD